MAYEDLLKDSSKPNPDNQNYFDLTITDLNISTLYPLQFRWKYNDGTFGPWSAVKSITTPGENIPSTPSTLTVVGGAGFLTVTWDGNTSTGSAMTNIDRIDIYINGAPFDSTKPADTLFAAGTKTIVAPAGTYIVSAYAVSKAGTRSAVNTPVTRAVTSPSQTVATPEDPFAPTITAGLASVIVSWNGKKADGNDFTTGAFASAKVYIGTSSGFTPSADNWVHSLNFANGTNQVSIGVGTVINKTSGAKLEYGTPYYIKIRTVNSAGTETSTAIASSPTNITVDKLPASEISTGILAADASVTAGASGGSRVVMSGASSPFIIYGTDGSTKLLEFIGGSTGTLAITGSSTFSGTLSIGSGNDIFKAEPATGMWLGNASEASAPFSVSKNGVIRANSGTIGGWTLASTYLQGTNFQINSSDSTIYIGPTGGQHIRISASGGIATYNGGTQTSGFNLSTSGTLSLSGSVSASSGSIGGWTIGSSTLTGGNTTLNSNGTISVSGGSATTTLNNNGTITIAAGSSGIGALSISGDGKTSTLYASQLQLNNAYIYESTGSLGAPPAGAMTLNTTSSTKEIHIFSPNDISGSIYLNRPIYYVGYATTTSTANTFINGSTGLIARNSASSQRYKQDIVNLNTVSSLNPEPLLSLPVRAFKYKSDYLSSDDIRSGVLVPGFIAEEMEEYYPAAVDYNDDGLPERWNSEFLIPGMLALIQQLNNRLDALEG